MVKRLVGLTFALAPFMAFGNTPPKYDMGQVLFEAHCQLCHNLDLPRSQRLSEKVWKDVMADMIDEGLVLGKPEQALIIEYLTKNYGPTKKKRRILK